MSRIYAKKVIDRAPVVNLVLGQSIEGVLLSKRAEVKTKFGVSPLVNIELYEPLTIKGAKKGEKHQEFIKGDIVAMFVKAGLVAVMELPEGTECKITCTGQVDTGKGNPAWTYQVDYN